MVQSGEVLLRPQTGGAVESWIPCVMTLTALHIEIKASAAAQGSPERPDYYDRLTPCSSVYETGLGACTFQLVTARYVFQLSAESPGARTSWLALIREVIRASIVDTSDSLFQQAVLRIDKDEIYHLNIPSPQPLGLVFERVGEWAVVQTSRLEAMTGVSEGSILCAVDREPVLLDCYRDTVTRLRKARPPMVGIIMTHLPLSVL